MPLRWLLRGLPLQDHAIKRYPAPVMAGLLIPFHHQDLSEEPVWIRGQGALAAYLAFGLETIACRPVAGWADDAGGSAFGLPTGAPQGAMVWTLDDSRPGIRWSVRGAKGA